MVQLNASRKRSILDYDQFIKVHSSQLKLIPKIYWNTLYEKIKLNIFDLDKHFQIETKHITYSNQIKKRITVKLSNKNGLKRDDPSNIFLIQHLVHFYASEARELIKELITNRDPLLIYLRNLMNIEDNDACSFMNNFLNELWRYVIPFQLKISNNKTSLPIWSITEKLGMVTGHSEDPNFQMITFQYLDSKRIYSMIFPLKDVNYGDEITRDYNFFNKLDNNVIESNAQMQYEYLNQHSDQSNHLSIDQTTRKWSFEVEKKLLKETLLIPWKSENLLPYYELDINFQQKEATILEMFKKRLWKEPFSMIRFQPNDLKNQIAIKSQSKTIKVYCDDKNIMQYLTDERYVFVNDKDLADVLWFNKYFEDFARLYSEMPNTLINQFPLSHLLNEKDILPVLCRRTNKNFNGNINPISLVSSPSWLPLTYDLSTELVKFVSYFIRREKKFLENYWIIRPRNETNSTEVFITNNLNAIIRLACFDRVASKYISNPVLFYRPDKNLVKFELNYFVVLTSILPLKLFVHKAFIVDCANKPFDHGSSTSKLYNQEMHLTDMNCFNEQVERLDLDHIEFINRFNYQYQYQFDFEKVDDLVMKSIREMFELCCDKFPFAAINHNSGSSALYRIDVILSWIEKEETQFTSLPVKPNILDLNLNPTNCQLICEKFPNFYNDIFNLMFLNDEQNCNFRAI